MYMTKNRQTISTKDIELINFSNPCFRVVHETYFEVIGMESSVDLVARVRDDISVLHGKKLNVTVPPGSNPGTTFSVHEQGLPDHRSGVTGRLFIKVNGLTPRVTNEKAKERLKKK